MGLHDDITKRYQQMLNEAEARSRDNSYYSSDNSWRDKARGVMDQIKAERSGKPTTTQSSPIAAKKPATSTRKSSTTRRATSSRPATTTRPVSRPAPAPQTTTRPAAPAPRPAAQNDMPQGAMSTIRRPVAQQPVSSLITPMSNFVGRVNNAVAVAPYMRPMQQQAQAPVAATQPVARPQPVANPNIARPIDQTAMNPSGAITPKAIGLDDRQAMAAAAQGPSLWNRVKNFFGWSSPQYSSGYGNDPSQDAYAMSLQRQNAMNAGSIPAQRPMFTGAGAEGQLDLLGGVRPPVASQPIRPAVATTPMGVGAEGQLDLIGGGTSVVPQGTAPASPAAPARDTASSDRRSRLQGMVDRLPPGETTTTTSPDGRTRTSTTTRSGKLVGGVLVDDQGRAVNPEEQDQVDQANEMKRRMSGGASGGKGITSRASTPPRATTSSQSNYQPQTTRVRKMSQRGAGAEGEM